MNAAPHAITSRVVLELLGPEGSAPAEAELRYDLFDPYAVAVAFLVGGDEIVWMFGRDLLLRGVYEPTGDGDVTLFPSLGVDGQAVIVMELRSPAGQALVQVQTRDVVAFLGHTTRLVWPGTEGDYVSIDDAIERLLVSD